MSKTLFTNARVVLADEILDRGSVVADADGSIADISQGRAAVAGAIDCEGDYLLPGLIELHTDNLEKHATPRPKTEWPAIAAVVAHDSQIAVSGITTVFDAVSLGAVADSSERVSQLERTIAGITEARQKKMLRADHLLHLRCEISYPTLRDLFDSFVEHPLLRLVSVMDHTPGQRQFVDESKYRVYYQGKHNLTDGEMDEFTQARKIDRQQHGDAHRRHVVSVCHKRNIRLASHDDATREHVSEAVDDGMSIAEFPTTIEAAKASHDSGLKVMMGGPNIVRGGSHSGNIAARDLAEAEVLDIVSSDYIPSSMLHAAFKLSNELGGFDLPKAIRTVTKTPAEAAGLQDRGEIAVGKRADIIRVRHNDGYPLVNGVWRETRRIA
jgi:alpha-D-ribose 1-methylphosphonate 5-triphosphate diphosphatase